MHTLATAATESDPGFFAWLVGFGDALGLIAVGIVAIHVIAGRWGMKIIPQIPRKK